MCAPALALALAVCHPPQGARTSSANDVRRRSAEPFSGHRALARVESLLNLPRTPGHPARPQTIAALTDQLRDAGGPDTEVVALEHTAEDPATGTSYPLTTLLAHVRPQAPIRFVIGTHYDTRPWAEEDPDASRREDPIPGANDGTSGVAVVLEVMPLLARQLPDGVGFTAILFDGEEVGRPKLGGYCAGSRALADKVRGGAHPRIAAAEFAIVLDMVGERGLRVPRDPGSLEDPRGAAIVDGLWATAKRLGYGEFLDQVHTTAVYDDHVPLQEVGVPAVLLIDHDYPYWHTHGDTLDKLSARSLEAVGETLRVFLVEGYRWPS